MKVLIIGGTGLISTGITEQLLAKGAEITHYNRGNRTAPAGVHTIAGDRRDAGEFARRLADCGPFDCVIDMIGYLPEEIETAVGVFRGRTGQYIFCSTVDVYTKQADYYPIDEKHSRLALPSFPYAYNKVRCENRLFEAHQDMAFPVTIFRPAQTYGADGSAIPSVGDWVYAMKRLRQGRKIIVHGDGNSIWAACHRDDVASAMVNAVCNPVAYGKAYNVAGEQWMTHNRYWRTVARALGAPEPQFVHIPTDLLGRMLPKRAEWCVENFQHNILFDNKAARAELGFHCSIGWEQGAAEMIRKLDAQGKLDGPVAEQPFYDAAIEAWERLSGSMAYEMAGYDR